MTATIKVHKWFVLTGSTSMMMDYRIDGKRPHASDIFESWTQKRNLYNIMHKAISKKSNAAFECTVRMPFNALTLSTIDDFDIKNQHAMINCFIIYQVTLKM